MEGAAWAGLVVAALSGLTGVATATASVMSARAHGEAECREKLTAAWQESERFASELHDLRMSGMPKPDEST